MALNYPSAPLSRARSPRMRVLVNGQEQHGFVGATVTTNNERRASEWSAEFATKADPQFKAAWWKGSSGNTDEVISIEISFKENESDPWAGSKLALAGRLDKMSYVPERGTLRLSGRDRTADFIEAKTFETYRNQTSSQVAQTLAAKHGLQAVVTATTTPVGRYYEIDHDRITLGRFARATKEWDLLCYLAQEEGSVDASGQYRSYDVFTQGKTLYFQPSPALSDSPYVVQVQRQGDIFTSNVMNLQLDRNLWLARDIKVVCKSWSSRHGKGFQVTAPPNVSAASVASGKADQYVFVRPNLTQEQAQVFANAAYADLTRHERKVTFDMPGDTLFTPRTIVQLQGTQTDFDQSYFVTSVERRFGWSEGFRQSVTCKNQSPTLTATVG